MKTDRAQRLVGRIGDQYVSMASDAVEAFAQEEARRKSGRAKLRLIAAAAAAMYIIITVAIILSTLPPSEQPVTPPVDDPADPGTQEQPGEPDDAIVPDPLPSHLKLPEGIEPKENEVIYQVALTSPTDKRSYIRLTYSDSSRKALTGIYLHAAMGTKRYKQHEIQLLPDSISNLNIIILSYYPKGKNVRNDQPTVLIFCRYLSDEVTCYKAIVTQYFQEKSALSGTAGWYDYYRIIDMQFASSIQYNYQTNLSLARLAYSNHYKLMFEKYSPAYVGEGQTTYHFNLIYSSIAGEEIMLQKDFTEFISCPGY